MEVLGGILVVAIIIGVVVVARKHKAGSGSGGGLLRGDGDRHCWERKRLQQ